MSQATESPAFQLAPELWQELDRRHPGVRVFATFGHGAHGEMVILLFDRQVSATQPIYVLDVHELTWRRIEMLWPGGVITVPGMVVADYFVALQTGVLPVGYALQQETLQ